MRPVNAEEIRALSKRREKRREKKLAEQRALDAQKKTENNPR